MESPAGRLCTLLSSGVYLPLFLYLFAAGISVNIADVSVIPSAVDMNSATVEGTWNNFRISWDPVSVPGKDVHYVVNISYDGLLKPNETVSVK